MGEPDAAIEVWRSAGAEAQGPLKALLLQRIAHVEEGAGRFAEAAEAYLQVGEIPDYPLRYEALGDAARCFAEAGDAERAIALHKRIGAESPETKLAPHLAARLRELEASQR
jgi:tetratricopeptide (TPR) repeat protein